MATQILRDAYAVLGVDPASDDASIAAAYRRLARRYHPDIAGEGATVRMMKINAAWDRLRDASRRAEYDEELRDIDPARAAAARRRARPRPRPQDDTPAGPAAASTASYAYQPFDQPISRDGTGSAGRPPGRPSGSILHFGRFKDWSIGEIARIDAGYLIWLEERPDGRPYLKEIDELLRRMGVRGGNEPTKDRKSRFGR